VVEKVSLNKPRNRHTQRKAVNNNNILTHPLLRILYLTDVLSFRADISSLVQYILSWYPIILKYDKSIVNTIQGNLFTQVTNDDSRKGDESFGIPYRNNKCMEAMVCAIGSD
jgi:hypothetical protein